MALDERKRTELARYLAEDLRPEAVDLMMEALSGPEWSDLATKQDLQVLPTKGELAAEVRALDQKIDLVEQRLTAEFHRYGRGQLLGFASIVALMNTALAAFSFFQS